MLAGRLWGKAIATVYEVHGTVRAIEGGALNRRVRLDPLTEARKGSGLDLTRDGYIDRLRDEGVYLADVYWVMGPDGSRITFKQTKSPHEQGVAMVRRRSFIPRAGSILRFIKRRSSKSSACVETAVARRSWQPANCTH